MSDQSTPTFDQPTAASTRGSDPNAHGAPAVTPDGRLCDRQGKPYPEAVQALRACVLPTAEKSADVLIGEALEAYRASLDATPPVEGATGA